MLTLFITAVGLVLVIEGILPFLSPKIWRFLVQQVFIQSDRSVRIIGLISMLIGLALVILARTLY